MPTGILLGLTGLFIYLGCTITAIVFFIMFFNNVYDGTIKYAVSALFFLFLSSNLSDIFGVISTFFSSE